MNCYYFLTRFFFLFNAKNFFHIFIIFVSNLFQIKPTHRLGALLQMSLVEKLKLKQVKRDLGYFQIIFLTTATKSFEKLVFLI